MCGLFGWNLRADVVRRRKRSVRTLAVALLIQNDDRGGDSWGFYAADTDRRVVGLGEAADMTAGALKVMCESSTVIGHTRKATTGNVTLRNCHPFRCGSVVGAHNGMVFNHRQLNERYKRKCEVDSEHLIYHLAEERDLRDVQAYGAVAFAAQDIEGAAFVGTFWGGELAVCVIPSVGCVWSSDWRHLERAVHLAGWSTDAIWEPEEFALYRITDGLEECGKLEVEAPEWKTEGEKKTAFAATGSAAEEDDTFSVTGIFWTANRIRIYSESEVDSDSECDRIGV